MREPNKNDPEGSMGSRNLNVNFPDNDFRRKTYEELPDLVPADRLIFSEEINERVDVLTQQRLDQMRDEKTYRFNIPLTKDYVSSIVNHLWESSGLANSGLAAPITEVSDSSWGRPEMLISGAVLVVDPEAVAVMNSEDEVAAYIAHNLIHYLHAHYEQVVLVMEQFPREWDEERMQSVASPEELKVRRDNELEADALSLILLANAGYDPGAAIDYLAAVQSEILTDPYYTAFSRDPDMGHPSIEWRIDAIQKARALFRLNYSSRTFEGLEQVFEELKERQLPGEYIEAKYKYQHYKRK